MDTIEKARGNWPFFQSDLESRDTRSVVEMDTAYFRFWAQLEKGCCEGMILFAVFTVVAIYFIEEEENYVIFERKRGDFIYSLINGRMSMDN